MSRRKSQRRSQQKGKSIQHSGTRNRYAVQAHFRHAGAMHDRRQARGGANTQQQRWLDEYLDEIEDDATPEQNPRDNDEQAENEPDSKETATGGQE